MDFKKIIVYEDKIVLDAVGNAEEKFGNDYLRIIDLTKYPAMKYFTVSAVYGIKGIEVEGQLLNEE